VVWQSGQRERSHVVVDSVCLTTIISSIMSTDFLPMPSKMEDDSATPRCNSAGPQVDNVEEFDSNEEEYEVEKIIDFRVTKDKSKENVYKVKYFVKWKGYGEHDNTWERERDIHQARELLEPWKTKAIDYCHKKNIPLLEDLKGFAIQTASTTASLSLHGRPESDISNDESPAPTHNAVPTKPNTNPRVTCAFCLTVIESDIELCQHIGEVHGGLKDSLDLDVVEKITLPAGDPRPELIWKCKICNIRERRPERIMRHVFTTHSKELPVPCDQCDQRYMTADELRNHRKEFHFPEPLLQNASTMDTSSRSSSQGNHPSLSASQKISTTNSGTGPVRCDCGKVFPSSKTQRHHVYLGRCMKNRKHFSCKKCGKSYTSRDSLYYHQKRCNKECQPASQVGCSQEKTLHKSHYRPLSCNGCGGNFSSQSSLNRHIRFGRCKPENNLQDSFHKPLSSSNNNGKGSSTRAFRCWNCLTHFPSRSLQMKHKLNCKIQSTIIVEQNNGRFGCSRCGSSFVLRKNVYKHIMDQGGTCERKPISKVRVNSSSPGSSSKAKTAASQAKPKNSSKDPPQPTDSIDDKEAILIYRFPGSCMICDALPANLRQHLLTAHSVPLDKVDRFT